jgi:hypothetical protein
MSRRSELVQVRKVKVKQNKIGSEIRLAHIILECCRIVIKMLIDWNILSVFCSFVSRLRVHMHAHACSLTFHFLDFPTSYSLWTLKVLFPVRVGLVWFVIVTYKLLFSVIDSNCCSLLQ